MRSAVAVGGCAQPALVSMPPITRPASPFCASQAHEAVVSAAISAFFVTQPIVRSTCVGALREHVHFPRPATSLCLLSTVYCLRSTDYHAHPVSGPCSQVWPRLGNGWSEGKNRHSSKESRASMRMTHSTRSLVMLPTRRPG